ncbi:MAG: hypothetical protein HY674_21370 [Chloroflexi bacterium]|nr:hypothetical protein [Chloroflexota bacterium]
MSSHTYDATAHDLARLALPPLLALALYAVLIHAGNAFGLLPPPQPILDPDKTILFHQSRASRSTQNAKIVLMGDSSCMVGVDALQLSARLPGRPSVINLSLIIGLDLDVYQEALRQFLNHNPEQLRVAVLLVTPQKLKKEDDNPYFAALWRSLSDGLNGPSADQPPDTISELLGMRLFRQRLLTYLLAVPLHGDRTGFYGFSSVMRDYLTVHHGSLVDHGRYNPVQRAQETNYFLAPAFEPESRRFRARLTPQIKLAAGLMPVPETHVGRDYRPKRTELLRQWNQWLRADHLLTNLPATLPDGLFASGAHLNERGQQRFTDLLAIELATVIRTNDRRAKQDALR